MVNNGDTKPTMEEREADIETQVAHSRDVLKNINDVISVLKKARRIEILYAQAEQERIRRRPK